MKKEKSTIHDIARKLNITASTVSRALNDHPRISEITKKAVQKTAQKLNYQPNHLAAALRSGKSNILGVIVPTVDRSFFASVVRGIEEIANNSRYNVMICQSYDNPEKEVAAVDALLSARVDGIIASYAKETINFDHFMKARERGIPVVLFDRYNDDLELSNVVVDDFLGAYKATEHLIQQGCKRIGHFTNTRPISIFKDRLRGYKEALIANGLTYDVSLVVESNLQLEDGRNSMLQLLKRKEIPDGIFSASAYGILGALQVLNEKGYKVPLDVALVGFSNEPYTSFTEPSLSTVEQHSLRMGNAAAEIFLEEVSDDYKKFIPQKIVLKPELIIRQSSFEEEIAQINYFHFTTLPMLKRLNRKTSGQNTIRPIKVLQFGDGNFLRGFVDWIIDILNEKTDFNGAVQIVRPLRKGRIENTDEQDGLYHVLVKGLQNGKIVSENRLVNCVAGAVNPYTDFKEFLQAAENPDLRFIVSNTTEAGLAFNPADQNVDTLSESFPAKLTQLLFHRFNFFKGDPDKGLILMPCELIDKNGAFLKSILLQYCSLWRLPNTFAQWLVNHNTFCNSLVDRIVPGFPKDSIADLQEATGFEDHRAVAAEPFFLWVIEAPAFVQQEFPTEKAGLSVKYVTDLAPYATRKVRILNGAHTALVPVAYLRGLRTVRESVEDPFAGDFIRKAIFDEIIPTLDLPAEELRQFADDVLERFQNPFIRHELKSIAMNSISKFRVRVLPTIKEYHKRTGKLPPRLVYSLAALIRFYKGDWNGEPLPVNDSIEIVDAFKEIWNNRTADAVPQLVLSSKTIWGEDLSRIEGLLERVKTSLQEIETMNS